MLRYGVEPADVNATLFKAWDMARALSPDARRDI
jgi:hypothetical protein